MTSVCVCVCVCVCVAVNGSNLSSVAPSSGKLYISTLYVYDCGLCVCVYVCSSP